MCSYLLCFQLTRWHEEEGEHRPFKPGVAGSSPARLTNPKRPCRLAWSRTPPFQGGSTGSNPVGGAIFKPTSENTQ